MMERRAAAHTTRARDLRSAATRAERRLWEIVRNRQFHGLKFRRQHPIGIYIADFYCPSLKIVLEVDGPVHDSEDRRKRDHRRTENLGAAGIQVVRLSNQEVLEEPCRALERALSRVLER